MELTFNNINPCVLMNTIVKGKINNAIITNDVKENETVAENVWVYCNDEDVNAISNIVNNL